MLGWCRGGLAVDGRAPAAGEVMREVTLLPDGKGIMVATGDCRLLIFRPQVRGCCAVRAPVKPHGRVPSPQYLAQGALFQLVCQNRQ